jgi:tRNA threonylcarbamoyladenosine biosynthesis protein TsaE
LNRPALTFPLPAPADTRSAGAAFAEALLESAGPPAVVTLEGPLGAGKTTFAQGFGEAMGVAGGEVASPTFTLADIHTGLKARVNHLDLYRLGGDGPPEEALREFLDAGLDECLDTGYSLVEWPERLPESFWPEDRFRVTLRMSEQDLSPGFPDTRPAQDPDPVTDMAPDPDPSKDPAPAPPPDADGVSPQGRVVTLEGRFPPARLLELLRARGIVPPPG